MNGPEMDTHVLDKIRFWHGYDDVAEPDNFGETVDPLLITIFGGADVAGTESDTASAAVKEAIFAGYAREINGCGTWPDDAKRISWTISREFFPESGGLALTSFIYDGIMRGVQLHKREGQEQ